MKTENNNIKTKSVLKQKNSGRIFSKNTMIQAEFKNGFPSLVTGCNPASSGVWLSHPGALYSSLTATIKMSQRIDNKAIEIQ